MPTQTPSLLDDDVLVQVGSGRKGHVFRPHPLANAKRFDLLDGGTVHDIALCGARGRMVHAADADLCASCAAALERTA